MKHLPILRQVVGLAATLTMVACSGIPTRTFQFDAIDVEDQQVPCLVVVDGDWAGAADRGQLVNVGGVETLSLEIAFKSPQVNIVAAPVPVDPATGKPSKLPKSRDESKAMTDYLCDHRDLMITDQQKTLLIVRPK